MREIVYVAEGIYECIYCGMKSEKASELEEHLAGCRREYALWDARREYEIEYFGDPRNEVEEDVDYDEE